MKIRFKFEARCSLHPRTEPEVHMHRCLECEALHVIATYTRIAARKARDVFHQDPLERAHPAGAPLVRQSPGVNEPENISPNNELEEVLS